MNGESDFLDCHTHKTDPEAGAESLVDFDPSRSENPPDAGWFSVGLHPWHVSPDSDFSAVERFARFERCLAIGETGLDHLKNTTYYDDQKRLFQLHAELAESIRKPLILHVVRARQEVLAMRRKWNPRVPWILHGFRGNRRKAETWLEAGVYLSFGPAVCREGASGLNEIREFPKDRILLETDDSGLPVRTLYEALAAEGPMTLNDWKEQMRSSWRKIFEQ